MNEEVKRVILNQWLEYHEYDAFYGVFPRFRGIEILQLNGEAVLKVNMRMGNKKDRDHLRNYFQHLLTDDWLFEGESISDKSFNYFVYDISDFTPPFVIDKLREFEEIYNEN